MCHPIDCVSKSLACYTILYGSFQWFTVTNDVTKEYHLGWLIGSMMPINSHNGFANSWGLLIPWEWVALANLLSPGLIFKLIYINLGCRRAAGIYALWDVWLPGPCFKHPKDWPRWAAHWITRTKGRYSIGEKLRTKTRTKKAASSFSHQAYYGFILSCGP